MSDLGAVAPLKSAMYEELARIGRAIASPKRLELLDVLTEAERSVEELAAAAGMTVGNTSQHLQVLRQALLLKAEKRGLHVFYRLADPEVAELVRVLRSLAERRLAEMEQVTRAFLAARESLDPVGRAQLLERMQSGEVTVLDVRPSEEYEAGHIPRAISVPLEELEARLADFPPGRSIVAYCRGPYCVLAVQAVEKLRAKGLAATRLDIGVDDWRARGLPVETGSASHEQSEGSRT